MFDSFEPFPTPIHDFAPGLAMTTPEPVSDAERKRAERAARRAAGLPDQRTVDVAIVAALATLLEEGDVVGRAQRQGSLDGLSVDLRPLMQGALRHLRRGKVDGVKVSRVAAVMALQQRLRMR